MMMQALKAKDFSACWKSSLTPDTPKDTFGTFIVFPNKEKGKGVQIKKKARVDACRNRVYSCRVAGGARPAENAHLHNPYYLIRIIPA